MLKKILIPSILTASALFGDINIYSNSSLYTTTLSNGLVGFNANVKATQGETLKLSASMCEGNAAGLCKQIDQLNKYERQKRSLELETKTLTALLSEMAYETKADASSQINKISNKVAELEADLRLI